VSGPSSVRVISYNVGFGDCFLLSFQYPDNTADRHVLIDFGTTKLPSLGERSLEVVARQIRDDTNGKLHVVVATHRHADHLSGFAGASGRIIASLDPDLVVQPWTEDPDLDPDATAPSAGAGAGGGGGGDHSAAARAVTTRLSEMDTVAKSIRRAAGRAMAAGRTPPSLGEELHYLGDTNIRNAAAVRALMAMGKRRVYARYGTRLPIASILPGIAIQVLGPPTAEQSPGMASMASTDAKEYWHLAASVARRSAEADPKVLFPSAETVAIPRAARWLVPQIDRMHAEESLAIVRAIDDALNNTSLILLFDIRGTKLLFPGDAQIEDWRYALFDAPKAAEHRAALADVAIYKVGHHGSLNGTPKTVWFGFGRRGDPVTPGRLQTMISTLSGKHGKAHRNTEVPRRKLMEALDAGSELSTTHTLRKTGAIRAISLEIPD
jgi:hypothetical protein